MKKILFLILVGIGIWYFLFGENWSERFIQFVRTRPEGKVWNSEFEKQTQLYKNRRSVVFLGDSQIEQCEWAELFPDEKVLNRGIPGETTELLLQRIPKILADSSLVFLQIGINDVLSNHSVDQIIKNYRLILNFIEEKNCRPVPTLIFPTRFLPEKNIQIELINEILKIEFKKRKIDYLDLTNKISLKGKLKSEVSWDGIHLNSEGYLVWKNEIQKCLK